MSTSAGGGSAGAAPSSGEGGEARADAPLQPRSLPPKARAAMIARRAARRGGCGVRWELFGEQACDGKGLLGLARRKGQRAE